MYKQRKAKPYYIDANNVKKTTFNVRGVAGVYMIYKNGSLRYVGYSGNNLYRTLYRHFQDWSKSKQQRVVYDPDKVQVRVIYCKRQVQAYKLETALILKYSPPDNPKKYEEYEPDESELKVLAEYNDETAQPIVQFKGDIPF